MSSGMLGAGDQQRAGIFFVICFVFHVFSCPLRDARNE